MRVDRVIEKPAERHLKISVQSLGEDTIMSAAIGIGCGANTGSTPVKAGQFPRGVDLRVSWQVKFCGSISRVNGGRNLNRVVRANMHAEGRRIVDAKAEAGSGKSGKCCVSMQNAEITRSVGMSGLPHASPSRYWQCRHFMPGSV